MKLAEDEEDLRRIFAEQPITETEARVADRVRARLTSLSGRRDGLGAQLRRAVALGSLVVVLGGIAALAIALHVGSAARPSPGTSWLSVSGPSGGPFSSIACPAANTCWVVGGTTTDRYSAGSWEAVSNSAKSEHGTLDGVVCVTAADCWAVGSHFAVLPDNNDGVVQPLIEQFNGVDFAAVNGPHVSGDADGLQSVTCLDAGDCWAVGSFGANSENGGDGILHPLIEHFDGDTWTVASNPGSSLNAQLYGVDCVAADECWAVGGNPSGPLIEQYAGNSWTVSGGVAVDSSGTLGGVTCIGADDCWAVGSTGGGDTQQPLVLRYQGGSWTAVSSPHIDAVNGGALSGIACATANRCWAAGAAQGPLYDLVGTPPPDTIPALLEEYSDGGWDVVEGQPIGLLSGITCTTSSACWAVGTTGTGATLVETTGPTN